MLKKYSLLFFCLFNLTAYSQDFNWLQDLTSDDQIDTCEATLVINNDEGAIGGTNHTLVICPDEAGLLSTIDFTEFTIPGGNLTQQFTIYDGDSDAAPILYDFPGNLPNGGFVSASDTNPTGCITIVYVAGFVPPTFDVGFEAIIDCREPCQDLTAIFVSVEADNICSDPGAPVITFPVNEQLTFNGDAITSNDTPIDELTFTWQITAPNNSTTSFTGVSAVNNFGASGTYQGTLIVTDEFFCSSGSINFSFVIGDNEILVSVQDAEFTLQELIEDVMVGGGGCANVDNISSPISSPNGTSIGYFNRGCSDFPFDEGIVLGSAGVGEVVGGFGNENSWPDVPGNPNESLLATVGGNPSNNVNDATVIEFEFSSFESEVSFNYIYASQEYTSGFPCIYADPFAFIVTGPGINDVNDYDHDANPATPIQSQDLGGLNVATFSPEGFLVPTTATNIHPGPPSFSCGPTSLGGFFYPEFFNELNPPYHNLNGETNMLTASFNVVPCEVYTMKLMIADWNDTAFNSFVFIEGGSFNIAADLGDDITVETDQVVCYGEELQLEIFGGALDANCELNVEWFLDTTLIDGESEATLTITEPGTYTVVAGEEADCNSEDTVTVEFLPTATYDAPFEDFILCGEGAELTNGLVGALNPFDYLAHDGVGRPIPASATTLADLDMEVHYFLSEQDAIDFVNPIENPEDFTLPPGNFDTEFCVRVNENISGDRLCPTIECFSVVFFEEPEIDDTLVENLTNCGDFTALTQIFDLTQNNSVSIGLQEPSVIEVSYYLSQEDAENAEDAIIDPANYSMPTGVEIQTIFLRAQNVGSEDCVDFSTFELFQYNVEIGNTPLPDLEACGIDDTDEGLFDLTQQNNLVFGVNQSAVDYSISYFESFEDANGGVNPIPNPTAFESPSQEIWVRIDSVNSPIECFAIDSFQLITYRVPIINEVVDLINCGNFSPETQIFDLTQNNVTSIGIADPTTAEIAYYLSQEDAEDAVNPILDPANYSMPAGVNQQTIFIRAQNTESTNCFDVASFELFQYNVEIGNSPLPTLDECSLINSDEAVFDLTTQNSLVLGGNQLPEDYAIVYYESLEDANSGTNPITDPATFQSASQEIWVRIDSANSTIDCFAVDSFPIVVNLVPEINEVEEINVCGDFSFTQEVDLSITEEDIFNGPNTNNWELDFFTSLTDANTNQDPITDLLVTPTQVQTTFYYRLTNPDAPACFSTGDFNVILNNVAVANSPQNLELCDDGTGNSTAIFDLSLNNALVFGQNQSPANQSVTYHTSFEDANGGVNAIDEPTAFQNTVSPQEIWVRITNTNDESCFDVASFFIETTDSAEVNLILEPLEACDENNDGFFSNFDLDSRIEEVNFLNNPDVQVSFHPTASDAETNQNPLTSPYANVVEGQQTIHVRVLDTGNGCLQTTTLELIIYDSPLLLEIDPIIECDTAETGIQFFDLTQVEENLFVPGQDTEDFIITYHLSEDAANNNTGLIGNPEAFQNTSSPQTVYIRVSDPASPLGCFNIEPIELIVDPLPEITPPTLIAECDDIESGSDVDEVASFDLTQKVPEITNNDTALDVFFYATEADQANDNPIINVEEYQNIVNPQTIEVSVFSPNTDCVATTTLTLVVDPLPTIPAPEPLIVCDADNEGTSEFDLLAAVEDILDGEVNTQITFHLTEVDANNADNPIAIEDENGESILFQNFNPFTQTLYIRAENIGNANINGTGCFTIRPLELQVVESPRIEELEDLVICDDESLNGFAPFDLVQNTANAIGEQESENLVVTYHVSQADAELGLNEISVPSNYTNITNPQTIYVRLFDTETECVDLFGFADDNSFTITVEPYPDLITPTPLEVCNTTANPEASFPTGTFDLTQKEEELTGLSPVPGNISFTYYESEEDLLNQESAIENPEEYINSAAPPMLIYVEATNTSTENQCSNTSTITLSVLPLPFPVELTEEELRLTACDDDNDGIAADPFDLTQIGQQITGSENNVGSYYLTEDAAINEDIAQQIADPTAYVNEPALNELDEDFFPTNTQIVWVRLDSNAVGNFCFVVVQIELIVEPNPELNPAGIPFGYTLCEGEPTQLPTAEEIVFSLYDVTNGSPNEIIPVLDPANTTQDPADYEYSLHLTEAEAEAGTNPVAVGYEATDGEILYLRVTHIITECYNIGNIPEVQITIEPRPEITDTDLSPIVVCADEQLNDADQAENQEVATIDLTQRDAEIDPNFEDPDSNTLVEYYASEEDLNNGIPIEDPTNFTTTETPTTIFAQVIDLDNFCSSFTSQSFEIQVNPLPLIDISQFDGLIVCINPQTGEVIETDFSPPILDTQLSEEFYSFEWTLNGTPIAFTGSAYTVDGPGIYTVTVTDITNNQTSCQASSSAEIIQSNGPSFEVNVLSLAFDGSHSVEVTNIQGDGDYEFQVDNGPWRSLAEGETSIIFTGLDAGERVVRGRDLGGCGEVEIIVSLIDYPRFFTPNEDGYNDTWNIIGLANQNNAKIYIFDRYGKLLKQLSPSGQGWNGTYNGKAMPGSDYWFNVQYDEPSSGVRKEFKANFTLKR